MDGGTEHLFSSKFACPVCSYSLPELEPRLFSFNSPVGACPSCDGLGQVTVLRPRARGRLPSLSLASGAVKGWDRRNAYTFSLLESVARHYGSTSTPPFEELPEKAQQVLLHGSGDGGDRVHLPAEGPGQQRVVKRWHPSRASSQLRAPLPRDRFAAVREDLALPDRRPCPDCEGTRLLARGAQRRLRRPGGRDARKRADLPRRALHAARCRSSGIAWRWGAKAEIADKGRARDPLAAQVPQRRRPELPEPGPQRRHAVRRRGAAHPPRPQIGSG